MCPWQQALGRDPQTLGAKQPSGPGRSLLGEPSPARRAQPCPHGQGDTAKAPERRLVQQLDADAACRPLKLHPAHRARRPGLGRGKAPGCRLRAFGCAGRRCWRRVVPTPCSSSEMEKPPPCPRGRPRQQSLAGQFGWAAQTRPLPGGGLTVAAFYRDVNPMSAPWVRRIVRRPAGHR